MDGASFRQGWQVIACRNGHAEGRSMKAASYEIERYRPDLRPGVIAIQKHLVSPDPLLNDAYFKWKHEDQSLTCGPIAYVALAGSVAGMRAFQGARWRLGDAARTASWPCACDFVVDPAHRGQAVPPNHGIRPRGSGQQGFGPVLNWSANPITYGASLRSGWRLVGPYTMWARHTARARRLRRWSERSGASLAAGLAHRRSSGRAGLCVRDSMRWTCRGRATARCRDHDLA